MPGGRAPGGCSVPRGVTGSPRERRGGEGNSSFISKINISRRCNIALSLKYPHPGGVGRRESGAFRAVLQLVRNPPVPVTPGQCPARGGGTGDNNPTARRWSPAGKRGTRCRRGCSGQGRDPLLPDCTARPGSHRRAAARPTSRRSGLARTHTALIAPGSEPTAPSRTDPSSNLVHKKI